MLRADEEALVCDLAETYGILEYRSIPAKLLGTLAAGLGEESRSKRKLSGQKAGTLETLLAAAVDRLSTIAWLLSAVCPAEGEKPKSILRAILGETEENKDGEPLLFDSPEDFDAEWKRRTGVTYGGR